MRHTRFQRLRSSPEQDWVPAPISLFAASISLASFLFVASSIATALIVDALGSELRLQDTEAGVADPVALRTALAVVLARQLLLILGIWALYRILAPNGTSFPLSKQRWWPVRLGWVFWAAGAYAGVIAYAAIVSLADLDWLTPRSTVGAEVTRDPATLALAALLAIIVAPMSEELLFRGVLFSALSRFGVLFGAIASGFFFAVPHFDTGSLLPFTLIGAALAWVYYKHRSLPAAIYFHVIFNSISFVLLVSTA